MAVLLKACGALLHHSHQRWILHNLVRILAMFCVTELTDCCQIRRLIRLQKLFEISTTNHPQEWSAHWHWTTPMKCVERHQELHQYDLTRVQIIMLLQGSLSICRHEQGVEWGVILYQNGLYRIDQMEEAVPWTLVVLIVLAWNTVVC